MVTIDVRGTATTASADLALIKIAGEIDLGQASAAIRVFFK